MKHGAKRCWGLHGLFAMMSRGTRDRALQRALCPMCTTRQHDVALARRSYRAQTPRMQHMLCGVLVECGARLTIRDAPHPPTDGRTWIWSSSGHRPSIRELASVANHFFRSPANPTRSCSCFFQTPHALAHAHILRVAHKWCSLHS
jgi:hypothetical protein